MTAHPGKLPRAIPARGAIRSFAPVGDTRAFAPVAPSAASRPWVTRAPKDAGARVTRWRARWREGGATGVRRRTDPQIPRRGCDGRAATLPGARPQSVGFTRGRGVAPNTHRDSQPRDGVIRPGEGTRLRARARMAREPANQARPSCCMRESWSLLPHRSTSFAPSNRLICKPCTENDLPVGGCPWKGPSWVPLSV